MPLEEQTIIFVTSQNIQISLLTKMTKLMVNKLSISICLSMPGTKTNLVRGDFG